MRIADIGGEFALIKRLTRPTLSDRAIIKGIGDDCAVLAYTPDTHLLVTVDMMVEDDHFTLGWHTPYQAGIKLMESNVSDIVAMGGTPRWAFLSLALTPDTSVEFMDELYRGLYASADRHGVALIGGDTTHGRQHVLNLTLVGTVDRNAVCLRSGAVPGDCLCVTGTLGKGLSGLRLLRAGIREGYANGHLEPRCRHTWEGQAIARCAHAMIDVSDGLASEVRHICEASGVGARIQWEQIPLSPDVVAAARALGDDPHDYALYGGEDFELVFAIAPDRIEELRTTFTDFTVVGAILPREDGITLLRDNQPVEMSHGYDHFAA